MSEPGVRAPVFGWAAQLSVVALHTDRLYLQATGRDLVRYHGPRGWLEEITDAPPESPANLQADIDNLIATITDLDLDAETCLQFREMVSPIEAALAYCQAPDDLPDPAADGTVLVDIAAVFKAGAPLDVD